MIVAVFGRSFTPESKPYVEMLYKVLKESNSEICIYEGLYVYLKENCDLPLQLDSRFANSEELKNRKPDFLITLGGDGTILDAATYVRDSGIPILGINLGRLGFLANIAKSEVKNALAEIQAGRFKIIERSLIEMHSTANLDIDFPFALNEVTTIRKDSTAMVTVYSYIDGVFLNAYWADGLIVATPTGSTGYSLSCGGPIIMPEAQNFVLTPIAPHNLNVRPFVIPDNQEIQLKVESREEHILISLDSRIYRSPKGTVLNLKKANFFIRTVQLEQQPFPSTLRSKLFWGIDSRN
jgi:NAD+ kinase